MEGPPKEVDPDPSDDSPVDGPHDPGLDNPTTDEILTTTNLGVFVVGLLGYGVGFVMLAAGWTQLAPVSLVGGLLAMVVAFLI